MASKGNSLIFKDANAAKDAIMDSQKKEIAALYEKWADEIGEKAKYYSHKSTASSVVSERQMKELQKMLRTTSQEVSNEVYNKIKSNMYTISDAVVADNIKWLESFGFSKDGLNAAFNYVPDQVVRNLITGQIYDTGWSLSARIWGDNEQTLKDAYQIMAKGLAENKPVYEIAKELETYVRPSAKLSWNPVLAMKNTKTGEIEYKRIYKKQVDYNAQRLARTLAQHSYQQSFIATTQKNPFVTEYIWHSNGSRVCELCAARDGVHFKKNELPMDHPNGMCTMEPAIVDNMVDQLADWFNSPDGTYPEIDAFASNFGYEASKTGTVADFINKYGLSTKSPNAWFNSLTPVQKAEAKLLKEQSGLTWNDWYNKNIYVGTKSTSVTAVKATNTAAKITTQVDDALKNHLKDLGFTDSQMPWNYSSVNDWYFNSGADFNTFLKLSKEYGGKGKSIDFDTIKKFFDDSVSGNVTTNNIVKATATTATKTVTKTAAKSVPQVVTKVVDTVDEAFDIVKWKDSMKANDLREMESWTKNWLQTISSSEKSGVVTYTGSAYFDMNDYLRGLKSSTRYSTAIKNCQEALSKASLPKDVVVRRGSGYNMLNDLGIGKVTAENKSNFIGSVVLDKGFMSTSPSPTGGFTYEDIEYIIKVPQGSQAMYVDSISKHKGEQELLINCGGKFKVEDVEFNSYGDVNKIYMTLINLKN